MSSPSSVVFLGTSLFATHSLEALLKDPAFRVLAIVTQPDKPAGRGQKMTLPPVKIVAERHQIPVLQPENLNRAFAEKNPFPEEFDFLVAVSYGQILSEKILATPKVAPVNLHASLLPRWRGASPIQHAILAGDRESGVTIQKMVKELDAGPILAQEKTPLAPRENAVTLHDRLAKLGASLLIETLKKPLKPVDQDPTAVTVCKKLKREDGIVDPARETAAEIDRKVRAFFPWPGVTVEIDGSPIKIFETSLIPSPESVPLPCKDGSTLYLVTVQPSGKKPMSGAAWARGKK